jgi:hypothetical protein
MKDGLPVKYAGDSGTTRAVNFFSAPSKSSSLNPSGNLIAGAAIALIFEEVVNDFGEVPRKILCRGRDFGTTGRAVQVPRALCKRLAGSQATFILRSYLYVD